MAKTHLLKILKRSFQRAIELNRSGLTDFSVRPEVKGEFCQTRREFIKTTVGTAAAASFLAQPFAAMAQSSSNPRIAIVGGGLAGLTAAYRLRQQLPKARLALFEANASRLGGRVYTLTNAIGTLTTELGGDSISENHSSLIQLAADLGVNIVRVPDPVKNREVMTVIDGQKYSEEEISLALLPYADALSTETEDLDNLSLAEFFDQLGISGWLRKLLDHAFAAEYGIETDYLSAYNVLWSFKSEDNKVRLFPHDDSTLRVEKGNGQVIEALANNVSSQMPIHLGYQLLEVTKEGQRYNLAFQQGYSIKEFLFDYVVLTIPYSVLKDVPLKIGMSDLRKEAIEQLTYGQNAKIVAGYRRAVWFEQGLPHIVVSNGPSEMSWDSSFWQNSNGSVSRTYYFGSTKWLNQWKNVEPTVAAAQLDASLQSLYPGITKASNGEAVSYFWSENPLAKGSYGGYGPQYITKYYEIMGEPVGRVFFAGEHLGGDSAGFMDGAVVSAEKAVKDIVASIAGA